MYDDPRVAVGPLVLSESERERRRRQNEGHPTRRQLMHVDVADVFNTNRAIAERIAGDQAKIHVSGHGGKVRAASALLAAIDEDIGAGRGVVPGQGS